MTERLREIEQRCEKATPGPWESVTTRCHEPGGCAISDDRLCSRCRPVGVWGNSSDIGGSGIRRTSGVCFPGSYMSVATEQFASDAQFIANAREDIPYLLGVIKEQAEEIERLQQKDIQSAVATCGSLSAYARWRESIESNREHSEDAKPLDGTVQE